MPVFPRIQAEALHLPRQIGAQGFGRNPDPGRDYGFHTYPVLAVLLGQGLGGAAQLQFGLVADRARGLGEDLVQQVFSGVVPVTADLADGPTDSSLKDTT